MTQQVTICGRSYSLSETLRSAELAPIFEDAWTASRVWEASRFLAERLVHFASELPATFNVSAGQSVLELGSGCGLAGLVAASLGADVLLTDQHEALELLQRNAETNAASESERARLQVAEFVWGSDWTPPHSSYHYILVSDCINPIYGQDSWRNLARSIYRFSNEETVTYLAHEARGEDEAMTDFLAFSAALLRGKISIMASSDSSIGIFWGPAGRLPSAGSSHQGSSFVALPRLVQSPSTRSPLSLEEQAPPRDRAATSLLEVLHTLVRSIKGDMSDFMKSMRAMDSPADNTIHYVGQNGPRYYSPAVAAEDREFFVREREMEADKEVALAASALARERHCAVTDKQFYSFDRRQQICLCKISKGSSSQQNSKDAVATKTARIDRHRRKIEHLLHVLQDEIAKETRREIEFLECSGPNGPASRQSRRLIALIIKARYEAADRIMRILEEYKIVIGVPAADYLLKAIEEGKALMS
ncbi:hypothetical protein Pcac1_g23473 [Phytophthora cactorum]|uniref:S-adenosyl-L-methionine-dependent methyltransferase n=2 Tax=Phytophthora cactorum TaxID=29920 RepID=A0A8T0ZE72_9STRA|nr:hypothetical protein Pcac1_g23473 [Phytophthora cactorum]KAG2831516.1 hypothetical protein PC112_g7239 [Phytophthora cactorum]KAG2860568.1 hypothetical protein PC113_g7943 [Phytophthora cactorum]KAG2979523.1 hypothetical protein PC118_g11707 [Phytophthora cactorum]KAG3013178.1 hypothetical protein PC119_g12610 [Phytophthora cactorum]